MQDITDNTKVWKTIRSYFRDEGYNQAKITTVKKDSVIRDKRIATLMSNYLMKITKKIRFEAFDSL